MITVVIIVFVQANWLLSFILLSRTRFNFYLFQRSRFCRRQQYDYDDLIAIQEIIRARRGRAACGLLCAFHRRLQGRRFDRHRGRPGHAANPDRTLAERFPAVQMLGEEVSEASSRSSMQRRRLLVPRSGRRHHQFPRHRAAVLGLARPRQRRANRARRGLRSQPRRVFRRHQGPGPLDKRRANAAAARQPDRLATASPLSISNAWAIAMSTSLVSDTPYKSQRNIGTCALEWAWLAAGRVNLLLHGREKLLGLRRRRPAQRRSRRSGRNLRRRTHFQPRSSRVR